MHGNSGTLRPGRPHFGQARKGRFRDRLRCGSGIALRAASAALIAGTASAADWSVDWPAESWNPAAVADDVVLPMPCGGAMAFRRIDTTVGPNWLADEQVQLGNSGIAGQEHSESVIRDSVAGALAADGNPDHRYYLLGKYEVTRDQYRAVTEATCPQRDDEGTLPAEGMSLLAAMTFAERYTGWLYENAPQALIALGEGSFLRLPTEEEWEFAARGGLAVTEAVRRQKLPPMTGALEEYVWYSGHKSCDGATQPIGLLQPNPLGLHDILGNVQELVSDPYRLRTRARAHGQAGGGTARGGSCLIGETRVRTAARDEVPPFDPRSGRPAGKPFTGLRLVLGAPILTGQSRISRINEDWRAFGETRVQIDAGQDPIESLGTIAAAEEEEPVREAIEEAIRRFEAEMEARNAVEAQSARLTLTAGMMMVRDHILENDNLRRMRGAIALNSGDNKVDPAVVSRAEERLALTQDLLLTALVHAAENFSEAQIDIALRLVQEDNAQRLRHASERTRTTTEGMLQLFAGFTRQYRARSDIEPQVFYAEIENYYQTIRPR